MLIISPEFFILKIVRICDYLVNSYCNIKQGGSSGRQPQGSEFPSILYQAKAHLCK